MTKIILSTTAQILVIFSYILIGFVLRRLALLPQSSGKTLSVLETTVFLPAMIFTNLFSHIRVSTIVSHAATLGFGFLFLLFVLLVSFLFAKLLSKKGERRERNTLIYIFAFSNYAYFGYPLLRNVFGETMLAETVLFAVPFTITIFTLGTYLLTGESGKRGSRFSVSGKMLPVLAAVFFGILFGLLDIKLPSVVTTGISDLSKCMCPVSMILTGYVLASYRIKELFRSARAYLIAAIRVILFPLLTAGLLWLIGLRGSAFVIPVFITSMPVGMNVVIFSEANGKNSSAEARICFISYLISLITIPIIFGILQGSVS